MSGIKSNSKIPEVAADSVLQISQPMGNEALKVRGYDFNKDFDFKALLNSFMTTGFQATNFAKAVDCINKMIALRNGEDKIPRMNTFGTKKAKFTIFLGYTSNLISSGVREIIRYLVENKMVDVIVTTAGGIEEDLIKCMANHYIGDFRLSGKELRLKGHNRIGNLLVPNENYCLFEQWLVPIIKKMHDEQELEQATWTPSKIIRRLGKEINDESSVCFWAYKNDIPIFCPALTDGSLGDIFFFQNYNREGFVIDILDDIRLLNDIALHAQKTDIFFLFVLIAVIG